MDQLIQLVKDEPWVLAILPVGAVLVILLYMWLEGDL